VRTCQTLSGTDINGRLLYGFLSTTASVAQQCFVPSGSVVASGLLSDFRCPQASGSEKN
jgi:hypothetical protein